MSFLWYWPAGGSTGWDFDAWKSKQHDWTPIKSEQSGKKDPLPLVTPEMTLAQWQREAAPKWRKVSEQILGSLSDGPPTQFKYEALGPSYRTRRYTMQRYRYTLTDEEWGYAWLLTPHERKLADAAVLALHQTSCSGKDEPVGIDMTPDERAGVYYAHELAERGFIVLAPDAIAFGERQSGRVRVPTGIERDRSGVPGAPVLILAVAHDQRTGANRMPILQPRDGMLRRDVGGRRE